MRCLRLTLPVAGVALVAVLAACGTTTAAGQQNQTSGSLPGMTTSAMPGMSGSASADPGQTTPVATSSVVIRNFAFAPMTVTVRAGTTVTWTNNDQDAHTVTATGGAFKSPTLSPGDTFRFTFATPGRYDYLCTIHPFMTATVVVTP